MGRRPGLKNGELDVEVFEDLANDADIALESPLASPKLKVFSSDEDEQYFEIEEEEDEDERSQYDVEEDTPDATGLYLSSMGIHKLLGRKREIKVARRLERAQTIYHQFVLRSYYVARRVYQVLERLLRGGGGRLDRICEVAVQDLELKQLIRHKLALHMKTISALLDTQQVDFRIICQKKFESKKNRLARMKRFKRRGIKIAKLFFECGVREKLINAFFDELNVKFGEMQKLMSLNLANGQLKLHHPNS